MPWQPIRHSTHFIRIEYAKYNKTLMSAQLSHKRKCSIGSKEISKEKTTRNCRPRLSNSLSVAYCRARFRASCRGAHPFRFNKLLARYWITVHILSYMFWQASIIYDAEKGLAISHRPKTSNFSRWLYAAPDCHAFRLFIRWI